MTQKAHIVRRKSPLIATALAFIVSACGSRFGVVMNQAVVVVASPPPGIPYYIVPNEQLPDNLRQKSITVANSSNEYTRLSSFLLKRPQSTTNESGFLYRAGAYALIVACRQDYRIRQIEVLSGADSKFSVDCGP